VTIDARVVLGLSVVAANSATAAAVPMNLRKLDLILPGAPIAR